MLKKNGCLQQKIKKSGKIDYFVGLFMVFMVSVVMLVCQQISCFMIAGAYVEDAIAASNLAAALIDVEVYGRDRAIRIFDPQGAYELYKEALYVNLQLDEDGRSFQRQLLEGPVLIEDYRIYNVVGDLVEIYILGENDTMQSGGYGRKEDVVTPDGTRVETTTVYSRVQFGVPGFGENSISAKKEKSVDVKENEDE